MTVSKGLSSSVERHLRDYFAAHEDGLPSAGLYDRILREVEKPLLSLALSVCDGNQLRTAELLGLNRNTLRKKLKVLGVDARRTNKNRGRAAND